MLSTEGFFLLCDSRDTKHTTDIQTQEISILKGLSIHFNFSANDLLKKCRSERFYEVHWYTARMLGWVPEGFGGAVNGDFD